MAAWATGAWAAGAWADGAWVGGVETCAWEHGAWATGAWANGAWQCEETGLPPVIVPTVTPAGRGRRARRKYVLEIDGQEFVTESLEHARMLLQQAQVLAEEQAQKLAAEVVEKAIVKARKVGTVETPIPQPVILAPIELQAEAEVIRRIYREAAVNAELQVMLAIQAERDDEEVLLLSL